MGTHKGKITYLSDEIDPTINAQQTVDLDSKHLYPGFIDAHLHLLNYAWKQFHEVDLTQVASEIELIQAIKDFIADNDVKKGEWVVGSGWNEQQFISGKILDKTILDQASRDHPILLNRACYHICAVNSKALEIAGISQEAPPIQGGSVDVDKNGVPTGILRENAFDFVGKHMPSVTDINLMKELILQGCHDLAKVGITTVHADDFAFVGNKENLLTAYRELALSGDLPIKVVIQLRVSSLEDIALYKGMGLKSWTDIGNLRVGPAKIIADGSLGSRTAAMEAPYTDDPHNLGIMIYDTQLLHQMIKESLDNDFDIAIHAIGDRTMNVILDAYEANSDLIQEKDFRPSIIHCQIASKSILDRFRQLNVIANIQPVFLNTDWKVAKDRVGSDRLKYSYCWKTFIDMAIPCAASSDAPIEDFNPLYGIHCAVARKDLKGQPEGGWIPSEALAVDEAIHLFTTGAAYASKEESIKGEIELGQAADFVLLSDDLKVIPNDCIKDIRVLDTFVNDLKIT